MSVKFTALIVDDEPLLVECFLENYAELAGELGVELIGFTDPNQALDFIKSRRIDLALLDYRMPRISGLELARELPPSTRKFLVTGELGMETPNGFERIISKPYRASEIESILRSVAVPEKTRQPA